MKLFTFFIIFLIGCSSTSINFLDFQPSRKTEFDTTVEDFKSRVGYLASDKLGGRSAGSKGDILARDYMVDLFKKYSSDVAIQEFEVITNRRTKETAITYNVIGVIPGNDPFLKEEFVIIGGHYDTTPNPPKARRLFFDNINNGADDNASGTAMVLELFEKYATKKSHKRSLVFILFGGEELGLLGSKFYAENPTVDLNKVQLMVNLDMIGRTDPTRNSDNDEYIYLIGTDRLSTMLHKTSEEVNDRTVNLELDYRFNAWDDPNRFYERSDHWHFAKNNIPVIFYFSGTHEDYHQPTDTAEKIRYDLLTKRTRLIFHTAWEIANMDEKIVVDQY